jgi:hypothetical protein
MAQAQIALLSIQKQMNLKHQIKANFSRCKYLEDLNKSAFNIAFDGSNKIIKFYYSKRLCGYVVAFVNGSKKIILSKPEWNIFCGFISKINKKMN